MVRTASLFASWTADYVSCEFLVPVVGYENT